MIYTIIDSSLRHRHIARNIHHFSASFGRGRGCSLRHDIHIETRTQNINSKQADYIKLLVVGLADHLRKIAVGTQKQTQEGQEK